MSDLATRNRSFFPPERIRSTALQGAATGTRVSSGSLGSLPSHGHSQNTPTFFANHLSLLRVASRGWFSPAWSFVEGLAFTLEMPG